MLQVLTGRRTIADLDAKLDAIGASQAIIEFTIDGTILNANENFLAALGYTLDEVKGYHHSMFVEPSYRESREYKEFWAKLGRGEFQAGEFKRVTKTGADICITQLSWPTSSAFIQNSWSSPI